MIFIDGKHPLRRRKRLDSHDNLFRKVVEFARKGADIGSGWSRRKNY